MTDNLASAYEQAFHNRDAALREQIRHLRRLIAALILSSPQRQIGVPDVVAFGCMGEGMRGKGVQEFRDEAAATTIYRIVDLP